ncbi:bifunctional hydroxymethylpyrimidine kinase/phosphomethylpyrimidine kinase, partial [Corynebacterium gottingense]|uniref:bifunctional hydroxymethylpyrimidine kinase/phosphomethylpyrimidine kinase n=1 Tax=Corynebacterium gottingense TaxID=2041036 RepID=UPI0039EE414C
MHAAPALPRILTIAGTDPTGGAGVQADIKSIQAAGGYSYSVVTSLVAQNTTGVQEIFTPPVEFLRAQLRSVTDDVEIDAIKIGMLGTTEIIDVVRDFLTAHAQTCRVVLDPVMVASSSDRLLTREAEAALRELARLADVITPNLPELAVLAGAETATEFDAAIAQAQGLARELGTTVIVKGGHLGGAHADNAVVTAESVHRVPVQRVDTKNTHGTGCSFSSALATRLGAGFDTPAATEWASRWLHEAIAHADALAVGRGHGPVDHGHMNRRMQRAADTRPEHFLLIDAPQP